MKKFLLFSICSIFLNNLSAFAEDKPLNFLGSAPKEQKSFELSGSATFGYDYSFAFGKYENNKISLDKSNNLLLDDRFRNYIYIDNSNISIKSWVIPLLYLNMGISPLSNGLTAEPLYNPESYKDFNRFIQDRKNGLRYIWQRFMILQDINFVLEEKNTRGTLITGQQVLPFSYFSENTLIQPLITTPLITPMTEYINFNLREKDQTPYQNGNMTRYRDIGILLKGDYSGFRFYTGVFNGTGPNTLDNNNEKDFFGRTDFILGESAEIGVSHIRGRHLGYKNIYSETPEKQEFEMYKTGLHGRLGSDNLNLKGEMLFSQESWFDKSSQEQFGWYLEGNLKVENIFAGALRYEHFSDNNPLKLKEKTYNYNLKKITGSLTQSIGSFLKLKQEYSHTWEDLNDKGKTIYANYGIFSVNVIFYF